MENKFVQKIITGFAHHWPPRDFYTVACIAQGKHVPADATGEKQRRTSNLTVDLYAFEKTYIAMGERRRPWRRRVCLMIFRYGKTESKFFDRGTTRTIRRRISFVRGTSGARQSMSSYHIATAIVRPATRVPFLFGPSYFIIFLSQAVFSMRYLFNTYVLYL